MIDSPDRHASARLMHSLDGPAWTSRIEQSVIARLKALHPDLADRLSGTP
ncbi:MAG: hypothetical protein NDI84_06880 [Steroidobacteraceae bacterium]|nr:hypothetical protein [Steroidobacteraceae bacterium]